MSMRSSLFALALALPATAFASDWTIDGVHSSTQFRVKHMAVSTVTGTFDKTTGTVSLDDADLTKSKVNVSIDVDSVDTRQPKRDAHLKSPDFFDAAKFPKITFVSTKIEKAGAGKFKVTGDLTMHGQTHPVTLDVEGPSAAQNGMQPGTKIRGVSATGKLSRKAWGITGGAMMVGDEVTLQIDAELDGK